MFVEVHSKRRANTAGVFNAWAALRQCGLARAQPGDVEWELISESDQNSGQLSRRRALEDIPVGRRRKSFKLEGII